MITHSHRIIQNAEHILIGGGVGVLPTDTIYGIVGSALNKKTVARIYKLRRRSPMKPMIILIGSLDDLRLFDIRPTGAEKKILRKLWPGKVSVVLEVKSKKLKVESKFKYLHRGTKTLAFRLPKPAWLRRLLKYTGPLVAPSANWEGHPPAKTIREAKKYFGPVRSREGSQRAYASNGIDFYFNVGKLVSAPSTLVKIEKGKMVLLRKGAVKL